MENSEHKTPLICDPEEGICEPKTENTEGDLSLSPELKPIQIIYFTDPICSSCWGIEPQLRKLKLAYGHLIEIDYHMGGLLPDWSYDSGGISQPSDVAHHWDEVSRRYDMPIDGDVWLEDPLHSSYPPSIAFKAAQMQDKKKAIVFLRAMRELLFLEKKNITKWEYVAQAAEASGLDVTQLKKDYEGDAIKHFEEDLALGRFLKVRGFPSMFFKDEHQNTQFVYGSRPYETYEAALLKLFPNAKKKTYEASWEQLFTQYSTMTPKEFSVIAGLDRQKAEEVLEELVTDNQLKVLKIKNGNMYMRA